MKVREITYFMRFLKLENINGISDEWKHGVCGRKRPLLLQKRTEIERLVRKEKKDDKWYIKEQLLYIEARDATEVLSKQNVLRETTAKHQWKNNKKCCTFQKRRRKNDRKRCNELRVIMEHSLG